MNSQYQEKSIRTPQTLTHCGSVYQDRRYRKLKREERECPLCCREIGDEEHCILRCPHLFLTDIRCSITARLSPLEGFVPESTDDMDELCYLLKNKDKEIMHLTSKLCFKIQEIFQELTYQIVVYTLLIYSKLGSPFTSSVSR